jgi:hypothetical protein
MRKGKAAADANVRKKYIEEQQLWLRIAVDIELQEKDCARAVAFTSAGPLSGKGGRTPSSPTECAALSRNAKCLVMR